MKGPMQLSSSLAAVPVVALAFAGVCLVAYLLGSIPFGLVMARLRRVDLRSVGSGNIGATNAARALGKKWGVLVLLLDAGKAAGPVYVALYVLLPQPPFSTSDYGIYLPAATAAAAFLGHLYPVFAGFAGGKGVATAFGGFLALEPRAALASFLVYAVAYIVTRISSVGSLLAVSLFPLWLYLTGAPRPSYYLALAILVFIVVRHRGNIERLLSRKEQRM